MPCPALRRQNIGKGRQRHLFEIEVECLSTTASIDFGPCDQHGPGAPTVFGFVSGLSRATIQDAGNSPGAVLQHDELGENFSCADWMTEDGPGRLVLAVPAVDGAVYGDLVTVFVLDD